MAKRESFSLDDAAVNTPVAPAKEKKLAEKTLSDDSKSIKRLTLDMPASLHRRLKIKAIENDAPMAEMVREWIEQRLS
ncbi:MAG: hypothetical protein HOK37_10680 [Gammaproteobacteria bacterium]|jgi:hypothetical protein|nr:hypothetical protein [Gammaproteobacteria bacterium]HIJ30882.1 hypothetical protein [Gammaproteobacteria bacterium]